MLRKYNRFDVNKEGGQGKRDRVYRTRTWKYLKYFIIPALVAFFLLCILLNVNFTKDNCNVFLNDVINKITENDTNSQAKLSPMKTKHFNSITKTRLENDSLKATMERVSHMTTKTYITGESREEQHINMREVYTELQINSEILIEDVQTFLAGAINCNEYKDNSTLYCSDGSVSFIDGNLDDLQIKCRGFLLNLMLEKCEFNYGTLQQSFFFGDFSLGYLSISQCNLQTIKAAAFKHANVQNLQTLIMRNNQLITLQDTSFEGLSNLQYFEFAQPPLNEAFKGVGCFKPLVKSLTKAIMQPSTNGSDVMVPLEWWQGLLLISLTYLDLSNTNLLEALNQNTFQPFEALEFLFLYNCNLLTITATTFDFITNSLKYLDLHFNHLQTLDSEFLQKFATTSIEIDLDLNEWYCECDHEMLQYLMQHDVKITEELTCSSPEKWQQKELLEVLKECSESETTTIMITTSGNSVTFSKIPPNSSNIPGTTTITTSITVTTTTTKDSSDSTTTPTPYTTTITTEKPTTLIPPSTLSSVTPTAVTTKTTLKPEFTTNTETPNEMTLNCYNNNKKTETFSIFVVKQNANFIILTNSFNSLKINIQEVAGELQMYSIIYYTNYSDYISVDLPTNSQTLSDIMASEYINDLRPSNAYVFCMVRESDETISPFDCRSHFLDALKSKAIWLFKTDKAWFIVVITIIAVLLFFISIVIVYTVMRSNPQWLLERNKRVRNSSRKSLSLKLSPVPQTTSLYLKSLPATQKPNNYDIESSVYSSKHLVPIARAPMLPPTQADTRISRRFNSSSCASMTRFRHFSQHYLQNMDNLDILENNADYQTIDHYESIK